MYFFFMFGTTKKIETIIVFNNFAKKKQKTKNIFSVQGRLGEREEERQKETVRT